MFKSMSKSEIAEIIGAIAVVIGLVFVGLELRQNTTVRRVTATQTLAADYARALDPLAFEADAACIYVRGINGLQNLDDSERLRFFVTLFQIFRSAEQLHYYSVEGMVEPRIWRGFERQVSEVSSLPGVQQWWELRRDWFSDDFQAYLDDLIEQGPVVEPQTYRGHDCGPVSSSEWPDREAVHDFARRYTAAWSSQDAASVAAFFAPGGSLTVNGGAPLVGRAAITELAQGFMTAFPDLSLIMERLEARGGRVVYRWRFLGTNSGPGGTGKSVDFSGFEVWRLDADGLIAESIGFFDGAEYERQVAHGLE